MFEVFGALGLIWVFLLWFEWKNIFHPTRKLAATPTAVGLDFEDVFFVADDAVRLHGWWIPHEKAKGTVIYFHGNAGNIGDRVDICRDLKNLGVNVFVFDYRGYGQSRGIPSERGTYRDGRAAYEYVRARYEDMEDPPVILYGASLGGAVAIDVARDKKIKGLIVENTFTSVPDIGKRIYPWLPVRLCGRVRYDSLDKIKHISAPKLFSHARQDEIIPYEFGQQLFREAGEPKSFVVLNCGHGEGSWSTNSVYWSEINAFVSRSLLVY